MKKITSVILILVAFVLLRVIPATFSYYADEHKWALIVDPAEGMLGKIPHPPLGEIIMHYGGVLTGYTTLRFVPLFFSVLDAILVFFILRRYAGTSAAISGLIALTLSMYSVLASTMLDTDGAIMPFFFLLGAYAYFRYEEKKQTSWLVLSAASAAAGTLIKLPFVLFYPTLALHVFSKNTLRKTIKNLAIYAGITIAAAAIILPLLRVIYPHFNLRYAFGYGSSFPLLNILSRDYFHTMLLLAITLIYVSPFIGLVVWSMFNKTPKKTFLLSWIAIALAFYLFIVDVSHRPLERYLMTIIYPLAILAGIFINKILPALKKNAAFFARATLLFLLPGIFLNSMQAETLPLYPKTAYVEHILTANLLFWVPLTGGSGPIGFQVTAAFIITFFSLAFAFIIIGLLNKKRATTFFLMFLSITLAYNLILTEEFVFSAMSPNVQAVGKQTLNSVLTNPNIKKIITFNDAFAYELVKSGKYGGRFYAVPEYFDANLAKFDKHNGTFMIIDYPQISRESKYWKYFTTCKTMQTFSDKNSTLGYILDCAKTQNPSAASDDTSNKPSTRTAKQQPKTQ
ncbi:glycosyltransferase family 39 protein [Candidatus Woesearchaeota archaeon]|nr:glycosyltransferase family 39 protein [Candidatus Woesearchaeota archaeon]